MRVAILHDYLNQLGGAERVLDVFLEIFPDADIYTILYDEKALSKKYGEHIKGTSILDIPLIRKNHRRWIPLFPFAARTVRGKKRYDLVISGSAGYAKAFSVRGKKHICYCHTPLRYAWDPSYLEDHVRAPWILKKVGNIWRELYLKHWDKKTAKSVSLFLANSRYIAEKVKTCYEREAEVVYPPIDTEWFKRDPSAKEKDYYLMAGRILSYKRFDLGIKACERMRRKLKVVGIGPEYERLKKESNPDLVEFVGKVDDAELRRMYSEAKALIFPQVEDFGLVAAEAQASGLPVIALTKGGAKEIIEEGKTGLFFEEQNENSLMRAMREFEAKTWDKEYISEYAKRFSKVNFKRKIKELIEKTVVGYSYIENVE